MPGPCSPTLLIIPAVVSCTRIGGLPAPGSADRDLTTPSPNAERDRYALSSAPLPAPPHTVIPGCGRHTRPDPVAMSPPSALGPGPRSPTTSVHPCGPRPPG